MPQTADRSDSGSPAAASRGRRGLGQPPAVLVILLFLLVMTPFAGAGTFLDLQTRVGAVNITQVNNNLFSTGFGNINALGVGAPAAGVVAVPVTGGMLYLTTMNLFVKGALPAGHHAWVSASVSVNFAHPAALVVYSCPSSSTCNAAAQFSPMSLNSGAPTILIPQPGITKNTTMAAGLAIFVPEINGASAFAGSDTATIDVKAFDFDNANSQIDDNTLTLNNPNETVQTALELTLSSASGGVPITAAADYALDFGNVNGIGIGPGSGLTVTSGTGGVYYATPYQISPVFVSFANSTASLRVYVSTDFAHPLILQLNDAAAATGPFTPIGKSAGTQATLTTTAASRNTLTRYLGLFVSSLSGPTSYVGVDTATLTYTLTVP